MLISPWPGRPLLLAILLTIGGSGAFGQQTDLPADTSDAASAANGDTPSKPATDVQLVNSRPTFLAGVSVNRPDGVYQEGDALSVAFQAERDAYLYLLYHQADGAVSLLFPNVAQPDNRIAAKTKARVPADEENFHFRIRGPFGDEALQVLASTARLPELDSLLRNAKTGAPAVSPELLARLAERLKQVPETWSDHRVAIRTLPKSEQRPEAPRSRIGLFIGIGKYQRDDIGAPHEELRRSAEVLHKLMLERGGLDPQRTRLVVDDQATRANLEEQIFRWLPSVSRPGDTVFIFFSGHAGQTETDAENEPDGQDETLAPYDIDNGTADMTIQQRLARLAETEIRDDTLARWIQELQGRHVVLILDTCHSGGVVEGKGLAEFLKDESALVKDISQLNTVVLTSCAADEQSLFEGTPNKTMWFTYFLAQAIEQNQPLSVEQAYQFTKKGMKDIRERLGEARVQTPTLTDNALIPIQLVP
ncbi:MAG: caspase family protein [Pirellulaceae bacterium]